ncbi:MAG: glycosyltransferase [Pseudomonadota bacterium]
MDVTYSASCLITFRRTDDFRYQALLFVLENVCLIEGLEVILIEQDVVSRIDSRSIPGNCDHYFVVNSGEFNKSWGINVAASRSQTNVFVIHDADTIVDAAVMARAIAACEGDARVADAVNPYEFVIDLDQDETRQLVSGGNLHAERVETQLNRLDECHALPYCGGIFVINRGAFYSIGGMDERFRGWGAEDNAMDYRIYKNDLRAAHISDVSAYHLYHPRQSEGPPVSRNQPLFSALKEFSLFDELDFSFKSDSEWNGDPTKYLTKPLQLTNSLPLISCLCVTRKRPASLRRAIQCFLDQYYVNRELIVLFDSDDADTQDVLDAVPDPRIHAHIVSIEHRYSLGELRNHAVELASGEYFCQWDDDDWYAPNRLTQQFQSIRESGKASSFLGRWVINDTVSDQWYLSNHRIWEGSVLCRTSAFENRSPYLPQSKGEELSLIHELYLRDEITICDTPGLYVYTISGENTWQIDHMRGIVESSTTLSTELKSQLLEQQKLTDDRIGGQEIPKRIVLTGPDRDAWQASPFYQTVVANSEGWDIEFYDDNGCLEFIRSHMPELETIYSGLLLPVQRSDLFRLVCIYVKGGFYLDTDIRLKKSLNTLTGHSLVVAVEKQLGERECSDLGHRYATRIANYMFGASPGNSFLGHLIATISQNGDRENVRSENDVLATTGPAMWTDCYFDRAESGNSELLQMPADIECDICSGPGCQFGVYASHYHQGSWRWQAATAKPDGLSNKVVLVHQTWKSRNVPERWQKYVDSVQSLICDGQHNLWTDHDNRAFISAHFEWFLPRYDAYPFHIQRVDAIRYFLLYTLGGLYVDMDYEVVKSLDEILDSNDCVLGLEPQIHADWHGKNFLLGNAFMYAAAPGHPFFRAVIEEISSCDLTLSSDENTFVLETTGPSMLTRVYEQFLEKHTIRIFPSAMLYPALLGSAHSGESTPECVTDRYPQAYGVHHHDGTWWKSTSEN